MVDRCFVVEKFVLNIDSEIVRYFLKDKNFNFFKNMLEKKFVDIDKKFENVLNKNKRKLENV